MTHHEYLEKRKAHGQVPTVPCTAQAITFGGRCLNCGYNPDDKTQAQSKVG